jgi:DivIVA domain-containing protein
VLSAQDVHDKQFKLVRQSTGYDIDEVDAFLDEVETAIRQMSEELAAARAGQSESAEPADMGMPAGEPAAEAAPASAAGILEFAQRTADEYVAEARRRADSLLGEAEQSARAAVADLEAQRTELEARVAALRAFETQVRTRLTGYFEGQLRDLRSLVSSPQGGAPTV